MHNHQHLLHLKLERVCFIHSRYRSPIASLPQALTTLVLDGDSKITPLDILDLLQGFEQTVETLMLVKCVGQATLGPIALTTRPQLLMPKLKKVSALAVKFFDIELLHAFIHCEVLAELDIQMCSISAKQMAKVIEKGSFKHVQSLNFAMGPILSATAQMATQAAEEATEDHGLLIKACETRGIKLAKFEELQCYYDASLA